MIGRDAGDKDPRSKAVHMTRNPLALRARRVAIGVTLALFLFALANVAATVRWGPVAAVIDVVPTLIVYSILLVVFAGLVWAHADTFLVFPMFALITFMLGTIIGACLGVNVRLVLNGVMQWRAPDDASGE